MYLLAIPAHKLSNKLVMSPTLLYFNFYGKFKKSEKNVKFYCSSTNPSPDIVHTLPLH